MVEILREKWCEDLDDILQCPICLELPKAWIYQCVEGHIICEHCKITLLTPLQKCPTCKKDWSPVRNRFGEDLCIKYKDIRESLIDPEAEINKLLLADTCCAQTQTDARINGEATGTANNVATTNGTIANGTAEGVVQSKNACGGHSGPYPCCIGKCDVKLAFDKLSDHIIKMHFMHFVELPLNDDIFFQHTWPFEFTEELEFDRAFRIPRVGIFFIKLFTNVFGDFTGLISMINSATVAKQFSYQLKIGCCAEHRNPSYKGDVNSCRTPIADSGKKCLLVKQADMKPLRHIEMLKCTVILTKKLDAETHPVPQKKKNRPKNRNNAAKAPSTIAL